MNRIAATILASLLALLCVAETRAAVNVGDRPELSFQAVDGTQISLESLRGKIVLIDFWATWCGPCMAEADHMVKINDDYGPKGLVFLGISLDQNKGRMMQVCNEKKFTWPQYFDGLVWKNKISTEWGVNGIPATYLINPDGVVVWKGHPAAIDRPLAEVFRTSPPRLVDPKVVAEANKLIDQAESALKAKDTSAALKVFAKIPADARKDGKTNLRIDAMLKTLGDAADKMLADADAMIEQKQYAEASTRLRDLSKLTGLPAAKKASDRLASLVNNPQAKAALAASETAEREKERVARAEEVLAAAKKAQGEGKHEQAYTQFKSLTKLYAGTPSADAATEQVKTYEKDPAFVKRANEKAAESKARAALSMAASYKAAHKTDKAREKLQSIIDEFPGTSFAETAKKELASLKD